MKEEMPDFVAEESLEAVASSGAVTWAGLDDAIIGHARIWRDGQWRDVLVYSRNRLVDTIFDQSGEDAGFCEADEYVDCNIIGLYAGPATPIAVSDWV